MLNKPEGSGTVPIQSMLHLVTQFWAEQEP